jgi:O-antigen/teichoic acid export membrane protein
VIGATLQKLGRQTAVYGFGDLLVKSLSFLLIPVFTRVWDAEGTEMGLYGLLHLAEAVSYIFFNLGLATAIIKVLADYHHGRARSSVIYTTVGLLLTLSLGLFLLSWAAAGPAARMLFGAEAAAAGGTVLLRLTLLATYLSTFRFIAYSLLRVEGRPWLYTTLNLVNFVVYVGTAIWLVVGERLGVQGVVFANLTASIVMLALSAWLLQARAKRPFSARKAGQLLAFGFPLLPNGLALWALALLDRVLLYQWGPGVDEAARLAQTGVYDVAYRFGMIVSFLIVIPLRTAWVPMLFEVRDRPEAPAIYGRLLTWVLALGCGLALALGVLAPEIIAVATRPQWLAAAAPLPLIAFGYVAYGTSQVADAGILARGRTALYPVITLSSVLVNIALCVLLIPEGGIVGAAWATLGAYTWHALMVARVSHGVFPYRVEVRRLLLVLTVTVGVLLAAGRVPAEWSLPLRTVVKTGLWLLYPLVLGLTGFLSADERAGLRRLRPHRRRGPGGPGRGSGSTDGGAGGLAERPPGEDTWADDGFPNIEEDLAS